jgi:hypothetical protein
VPSLIQVNNLPLYSCLVPAFEHFEPGVTAELAVETVEATANAIASK